MYVCMERDKIYPYMYTRYPIFGLRLSASKTDSAREIHYHILVQDDGRKKFTNHKPDHKYETCSVKLLLDSYSNLRAIHPSFLP